MGAHAYPRTGPSRCLETRSKNTAVKLDSSRRILSQEKTWRKPRCSARFSVALNFCSSQATRPPHSTSNRNPFDFVQRDFVAGSVVQLRGAWRLVGGDCLGVLDRAAILKIRGDSGGPEGVTAGGGGESGSQGAAFDHAEHVGPASWDSLSAWRCLLTLRKRDPSSRR